MGVILRVVGTHVKSSSQDGDQGSRQVRSGGVADQRQKPTKEMFQRGNEGWRERGGNARQKERDGKGLSWQR